MYVNQLPWLAERFMLGRDGEGAAIAKSLIRSGLPPEAAERDARAMAEAGALTAALNWYRAVPMSRPGRGAAQKITVPTLYVWSDRDIAITAKPAHDTAKYVSAPYRFETLRGASHWLPEEKPAEVAEMLLQRFATYPVQRLGIGVHRAGADPATVSATLGQTAGSAADSHRKAPERQQN